MPSCIRSVAGLMVLAIMASCASPPVWRAATLQPDNPMPTLMAAGVYSFFVPTTSIDLSGVDLGEIGKAVGNYAKDNPDKVIEAGVELHNAAQIVAAAHRLVANVAPGMQQRAASLLNAQGFQLEYDAGRAQALGEASDTFSYVVSQTCGNPFGHRGGSRDDGDKSHMEGTFPIWGQGNESSIAEALKTGRACEAYASIQAEFTSPGSNPNNGVTCALQIQVIDQSGTQVFQGRTTGTAPKGSPESAIEGAFAAALAQMKPVVLE